MLDARHNQKLKPYEKAPCHNCSKFKTYEGHDGCLGTLDGLANACCGHGDVKLAYVQFLDGVVIQGELAVKIQSILKSARSNETIENKLEFMDKCYINMMEVNK